MFVTLSLWRGYKNVILSFKRSISVSSYKVLMKSFLISNWFSSFHPFSDKGVKVKFENTQKEKEK